MLAVDAFLVANGIFLALANNQTCEPTKATAMHNQGGSRCEQLVREIASQFETFSIGTNDLKSEPELKDIYRQARYSRLSVRMHPANLVTKKS